ncbi:MAG: AI-2E family transporter [Bacteroidaceae bacterium]
MLDKKITFDSFVRSSVTVVAFALIIYALNYMSSVLIPFFIAWIIAYMINPLVEFFQYKLRFKSRVLCILITLLLIVGIITGLILLSIPRIVEDSLHLKNIAMQFLQHGTNNSSIPQDIERFIHNNMEGVRFDHILKQEDVIEAIKSTLPKIWSLFYRTADVMFSLLSSLITLLYLFFILKDYDRLSKDWINYIPKKHRPFASALIGDVEHGMNSYFRGQALVALCVGILFSIGFLIIGFPMAIGLGLFIGFLNLVPYLQLIGFVPTIFLALLKAADTGQNFWGILACAVGVFCVVQLIQDLLLTPKIMGKIMGLSPAAILLSLSIWGYLLGIIGLIIALPLTTLIMSYYHRYVIKEKDPLLGK